MDRPKELLRITVPNVTCNALDFMADGRSIISGADQPEEALPHRGRPDHWRLNAALAFLQRGTTERFECSRQRAAASCSSFTARTARARRPSPAPGTARGSLAEEETGWSVKGGERWAGTKPSAFGLKSPFALCPFLASRWWARTGDVFPPGKRASLSGSRLGIAAGGSSAAGDHERAQGPRHLHQNQEGRQRVCVCQRRRRLHHLGHRVRDTVRAPGS